MLSKIIRNVKQFWDKKHILTKRLLKNNVFLKILKKIIKKPYFSLIWKATITLVLILTLILIAITWITKFNRSNNGLVETLNYTNSLLEVTTKTAWSNKKEFCNQFAGTCYWGSEIPKDTDINYIIFFINQADNTDINSGEFSSLIDFRSTTHTINKKNYFLPPEKARILEAKNIPQNLLPTAPSFSFAVLGDSQNWPGREKQTDQFENILNNLSDHNPDFIISVGDLTGYYSCGSKDNCRKNFEAWRDRVSQVNPRIYPAVGNHDYENAAMDLWSSLFKTPNNGPAEMKSTVFSFDQKNSHFIFLNSEIPEQRLKDSIQFKWLENDLQKNKKKNVFVISHRPDYPSSSFIHTHKWKTLMNGNLLAYFSGHIHTYCQRQITPAQIGLTAGKAIEHYIIGNSGSKGGKQQANCLEYTRQAHFAIVKVQGSLVKIKTFDIKGNQIFENDIYNENYYD